MASTKKPRQGGDDLAILHPDREATIAGRKITMREYGFVEGMRLSATAAPLVDALADAAESSGPVTLDAVQAVFGAHSDAIVALIAQACDQPAEWVAALNDADGQNLFGLWWAVNGGFFVRRVVSTVQVRTLRAKSAGASSTQPSSATATTRAHSEATPAVN